MNNLLIRLMIVLWVISCSESGLSQDSKDDSRKDNTIDSLLSLSLDYVDLYSLDSAIQVLDRAESLIKTDKNHHYFAKIYFYKGYTYGIKSSIDSALAYYNLAEGEYRALGKKEAVVDCLNNKGSIYYFAGKFDQAAQAYSTCLSYAKEHNLEEVQLHALNNLGVTYRQSGKNTEAINIYTQTLALSKKIPNQNMIGASYHNIGVALSFDKNFDQAITYLDSAFKQYSILKDTIEMGRTSNAIADAYYINGKGITKTKKHLLQAEGFLSKYKDNDVLPNTYLSLGNIEKDLKNYSSSEVYYKKGLRILEGTDREDQLKNYYKAMESLYHAMGDNTTAYNYLSKYQELYEKLKDSERIKTLEEVQAKYETEQKESKIALLNSKNETQKIKLEGKQNELKVLGIGAVLLFGFSIWVYNLYQKLKKQNEITVQALKDKDTLLREIHHRVKNNLQLVSGLLTLQSDHVKDKQAVNALKESEVRVQSIALLHQDLYANDNLRDVNTNEYFSRLLENLRETFSTNQRKIDLTYDIQPLILDLETMIPLGLMVNELVTNSLKHAFTETSGGNIQVTLSEKENTLTLRVKDDGQAKDPSASDHQSFGYTLVEYFAMRLNGKIDIKLDHGLDVEFKIRNFNKVSKSLMMS